MKHNVDIPRFVNPLSTIKMTNRSDMEAQKRENIQDLRRNCCVAS